MSSTAVEVLTSEKYRTLAERIELGIRQQYLEDRRSWVLCFSGGKDSTALLQLVFGALSCLPRGRLNKEIHVLCNDTLVENPSIAKHVDEQLARIGEWGKQSLYRHNPDLFQVTKVEPTMEDRFWVNLVGKGYPSPNRWFRWCTKRLKIRPTNQYIADAISTRGETIIVLGTRKAESANRAKSMRNYDNGGRLRNHTLPNTYVFTPIADLSDNDVWAYLLHVPNPWGGDNLDLLAMYENACSTGECPFVIDTGTQSCGKSRFGCWVCTVVRRDRSMENYIRNGERWLTELLNFRDWLYDIRQEDNQGLPTGSRNGLRFSGFLLCTRREILRRLLEIQQKVKTELISAVELDYVRQLLERDLSSDNSDGLRQFAFQLPDKVVTVISDFDPSSCRKRLGSMSFSGARLISFDKAPAVYSSLTRVAYRVEEPTGRGQGDIT